MINKFTGRYNFLSNFYHCTVHHKVWPYKVYKFRSAEHAYQAAKATNEEDRAMIARSKNPALAKSRGQLIPLRKDWNEVRCKIMHEIILDKFTRNPTLRKMLVKTKSEKLIEGNWWNDTFWGVCNGEGENHLGKILMQVRRIIS